MTTKQGKGAQKNHSNERNNNPVEAAAPFNIEMYLIEIVYPVVREDLVANAKMMDAPDDVIRQFETLPDQSFEGPDEVLKELGP